MMNQDEKTCQNCIFYDGPKSICRKHAPGVQGQENYRWPQVEPDEWCGEWVGAAPTDTGGIETFQP